ncbi:MAG: hypothetical protein C4524_07705 [Candidatus Zixiibacteriota bacterium]|nr:MAG: hypothetical protein C4524_07705 [candidate division Zixibacteria bacterium]
MHVPDDFKEFLKLLNGHQVKYLLIGGYAVAHYGYPRATADMDVWVERSPENARKVAAALKDFGFATPDVVPELFLEEDRIIRMGTPPLRLKIWTSISGVEFEAAFEAKSTESIDGVRVFIISLDMLKQNKRASGRHKDLDDLEHLP